MNLVYKTFLLSSLKKIGTKNLLIAILGFLGAAWLSVQVLSLIMSFIWIFFILIFPLVKIAALLIPIYIGLRWLTKKIQRGV